MLRPPLALGLQIPNFNFPGTEPGRLLDRLTEIATAAEQSSFDSVWVMDHLHQIPTVGPETNWMFDGNTVLAALAARTTSAQLGLMVSGVTYRNPALLAKITTGIDVLSGGRAILGIGAAWFEREHDAYGFEFPPLAERFRRLEDALIIARMMFTQPSSTHHGHHHSVDEVLNNPPPLRGDIPILVGGSGERKTLRLVARHADACNVFGDAPRVRHLMEVLHAHCEAEGRDPAEIVKTRLGTVVIAPTHEQAQAKLEALTRRVSGEAQARMRAMVICGDPDGVAEQAGELLDAGLDGLIVNLPDAHDTDTVALVGETLGAVVGARH